MRRLLKLFFELGEIGIGVGGVVVSNQQAAGTGGDGLLQAQFGGAVAPADTLGMLGGGVLPVADEEIGFVGEFAKRAGGGGRGFMIGGKNKGALFSSRGALDTEGQAPARVGNGGRVDLQRVGASEKLQRVAGLDFVEDNFRTEHGKSGWEKGFALLGVEGALDQVSRVGTGKAGGVDGDLGTRSKGGREKRETLQMIPVGVGKKKSESAATVGGPFEASLAEARAGIEDE